MKTHALINYTVLVFVGLSFITGCDSGPMRYAVEGTVTLDGKPLEVGSINFKPIEGTASPTAGGEIKNGKYYIARDGGPMAGEFKVEITASRPGRHKFPDATGKLVPAYEQYLPEKYNNRSELRAKVEADGANHFDFPLEL